MSNTRPSGQLLRLLLALLLSAACSLPAAGSGSAPPDALGAPVSLDISSLTPFFATLSPDEKDEQLRDWAVYGLQSALSLGTPGEMPVRHPALMASRPGEVAPGRVFAISPRQWGLVVPQEALADKPLLGGLVDRKFAALNRLPEKVLLYSYSANAAATAISIACAGSLDAQQLFTPEYGYYSASVRTLADLSQFMARIDDLVSLSWQSDRLLLGGRRYLQSARRSLTVQDVATLYQAYHPPPAAGPRIRSERFIQEKYAELLRSDARLQKALRRGAVTKSRVLALIRRRYPPQSPELQVGFSLDPAFDYPALAEDLRKLTGQHSRALHGVDPALAAVLSSQRGKLGAVALSLERRRDLRPLLELRRRFEGSPNQAEQRFAATLRYLETAHAYQAARYDGRLQGTSVGMVLFYTDLLAKLWALDYQGTAPRKKIKGFRTMLEIQVPKLDWNDFARLSKTRLWFGLRDEGFDVYGDTLLFQPAITRVYAASSDPLFPGKETPPNYQSREFLGWWDRHYETVADVEPYYHKLDQIQKWGCACMILKEKKSHLLDFLLGYPVQRDLDFASWVKTDPTLAQIGIPFLDSGRFGRGTECLPLLRSRDYRLMGKDYVLSGGVSLASRKDILAKLHRHDPAGSPAASPAPGLPAGAGGARRSGPAALNSPPPRASQDGPARQARGGSGQQAAGAGAGRSTGAGSGRSPGGRAPAGEKLASAAKPASGERRPAADQTASGPEQRGAASAASAGGDSGSGYGSFSAQQEPGAIRLAWKKGPAIALHELVASLAALQQADGGKHQGEAIFGEVGDLQSVVRLEQWSAYLVKTGASDGHWIYLGINPAQLAGYPARAAAAFPEADVFCARLVSEARARKLAAGRPLLR